MIFPKGLPLALALVFTINAHAFEVAGLVGYAGSHYSNKPTQYLESTGGVGYEFIARTDLGPGMIESGFVYSPTSVSYTLGSSEVTADGSFWIIPLLYHFSIYPPFLSMSLGPDFALKGNTHYTIQGPSISPSDSGFQSHFGAQASLQTTQDLGENISAIIDIRYRLGLSHAISILSTETTKFNFFMVSLGIQKRFD